jgi:periplasmic protein TonB
MRFLISMILGILVALTLFLVMDGLISGRNSFDRDRNQAARLDFIQVDQDEFENVKRRTPPPKPEAPKKPPPPPKITVDNPDQPPRDMPRIDMPRINLGIATGSGPYLGSWSAGNAGGEGDVIPIVRIEPQFPREALIQGISGWVEVEFTIEADGSVSKPRVIASEPSNVFDRNAIRAIYKWKFKPRIVDGKPVARRATQRLDFNLQQ